MGIYLTEILEFNILFRTGLFPQIYAVSEELCLLAVEPHADSVGIVQTDAVHLAPGICGGLQLGVIATHLAHLVPEVVEEDGLDLLDDELLA